MREKILIAENDHQSLQKMTNILAQNNYQVITASRSEEMIDRIEHDTPELLLVDYSIPQMNDPDLFKKLHKHYEDTFIIFIINKENEPHVQDFIRFGADDYLVEPFDECKFLTTIDNALKFRHVKIRNKMICQELVDANQKLSIKSRQFQELVDFHNSLLEHINVGIFSIDSQFNVTSWNKKIQSMTGIVERESIGQNLFSLIPILREDNIYHRISQVIYQGQTTELGHIYSLNSDGESICCAYKISPLRKKEQILGAVVMVDDVTQKVSLQQELQRTQRYLSNLVENSTDAIISLDLDELIVTWNVGAKAIFGFSAEEAIGRRWDIFIPASLHDQVSHLFEWVKDNSSVKNLEVKALDRQGEEVPVTMSLSLIRDPQGKILGISCIARDLSEKRDLQNQIVYMEKMTSLGSMAAGIAHDINNPLSSILAYADLMGNKTQKVGFQDLTEHLSKVEENVDRVAGLVKKMTWYAKPSCQIGLANLHELLNNALEFSNYQIPMQSIQVTKEYAPDLPSIPLKGRDLVHVFVNLITNATKAMPNGGSLTIKTILKKNDHTHDEVLVSFADTGIGIPEENLSKIFNLFFTTQNSGKGTGLGLFIVKTVIEDLGGSIRVESKVNQGTTFIITLPIKEEGKPNPFV